MSTIDRAALILAASQEVWDEETPSEGHLDTFVLALPVIAKALLAPLRELHHPRMRGGKHVCAYCGTLYPCTNAELINAIEAEVQP